jgi:hypothetical protein
VPIQVLNRDRLDRSWLWRRVCFFWYSLRKVTWTVLVHPEAWTELLAVPTREQVAVENAMKKLEVLGQSLPFPHSSAVQDADRLRELRPRAGRCLYRAFYRQVGDVFVIAAVGPEANVKPRDFTRAVRAAEDRLSKLEES